MKKYPARKCPNSGPPTILSIILIAKIGDFFDT